MTLQQYQENTFGIQPFCTTNIEKSTRSLQSDKTSFYSPYHLLLESNELKKFSTKLKNRPNLNPETVNKIATKLGLIYTVEKEIPEEGAVCFANSPEVRPEFRLTFTATDVFDYIYAVLHSPSYREKCKEFLKSDLPRAPYPKDTTAFWQLVKLGDELRQLHLLALTETERIMKEIDKIGSE